METNKNEVVAKKKRRIIVILCIVGIIAMMGIGFIIGTITFNIINKNDESQNDIQNTIDNEGDDNVLTVPIDEDLNTNPTNTPEPDPTPTPSPTSNSQQVETPYYIKVNYGANVVTVYKKDSNRKIYETCKNYGLLLPEMQHQHQEYIQWQTNIHGDYLNGNVYGQYACRIVGSILFHSVPYEKKDKSTLEWWEYDKLGTKASLGCIRLTVEDAKWIYDNCVSGTNVEFYTSSNPGPLGKPTAQKITADEEVRNWDPTDPDSKNPWKTYNKNQNNQSSNAGNGNTNTETNNQNNANTNSTNNNNNNVNNTNSANTTGNNKNIDDTNNKNSENDTIDNGGNNS